SIGCMEPMKVKRNPSPLLSLPTSTFTHAAATRTFSSSSSSSSSSYFSSSSPSPRRPLSRSSPSTFILEEKFDTKVAEGAIGDWHVDNELGIAKGGEKSAEACNGVGEDNNKAA
ncbi:hypothetical protein PIB30_083465, partial [Stylosanthes scabra]|nr:hypothetical protein [Stylosanthes scabra]